MTCDRCHKDAQALFAKGDQALCSDCRGPVSGLLKGAWH